MRSPKAYDQDEEKLKQLILYVSQKCADQKGFGATKLNKILYFSDFLVYANTGKPITGVAYQRLEWGPAPRRMKPLLSQLEESGELAMQEVLIPGGYRSKKPVNLVAPNLSLFSAEEIATVDEVIDNLEEFTASDTSRFSHDWGGWKYADDRDLIPYESVFISNKPITRRDRARGREVARQHGLLDG